MKPEFMNVQEPEEKDVNFREPHKFEPAKEGGGKYNINYKKSEIGVALGALGRPTVFYLGKANKYYKNADCTKLFTDEEIQAMNLPIPAELENERKKLRKQVVDGELDLSMDEIIQKTMPEKLDPPDNIKAKIAAPDATDRMVRRINRSTLGKG
ncbi:MAG: hypothetical protein ACW99U_17905 [Candidatus Thorarchaeota archaeon]|jgi:hypothetical protein